MKTDSPRECEGLSILTPVGLQGRVSISACLGLGKPRDKPSCAKLAAGSLPPSGFAGSTPRGTSVPLQEVSELRVVGSPYLSGWLGGMCVHASGRLPGP